MLYQLLHVMNLSNASNRYVKLLQKVKKMLQQFIRFIHLFVLIVLHCKSEDGKIDWMADLSSIYDVYYHLRETIFFLLFLLTFGKLLLPENNENSWYFNIITRYVLVMDKWKKKWLSQFSPLTFHLFWISRYIHICAT